MHSPVSFYPPKRFVRSLLAIGLIALLQPGGSAFAGRLVIDRGRDPALRRKPTPTPVRNFRRSLGSARSILQAAQTGQPDSITVLVIRVDFPPDTISATTGSGQFLYEPSGAEAESPLFDVIFDHPPHDRRYFQWHIGALNNYYRAVSHDLLRIGGIIFPDGDRASYRLPQEMVYYSPVPDTADMEFINKRLVEFFRDAVETAAADPLLDFALFDSDGDGRLDNDPVAVMIVHAGSDFQADQGNSPSDIRSAFIPQIDLPIYLGPEYHDGIPADGVLVLDGVVVPETSHQPELVERGIEFGLNGVIAHEFGHQLGLPDFYFTSGQNPGVTAIGGFCLMDAGNFNGSEITEDLFVFGFLPAFPNAWCRRQLGWETDEEGSSLRVTESDEFELKAAGLDDGLFSVAVPATADEYFMVENRQSELTGDNAVVVDTVDGGVWWLVEDNEYDGFLPGSGLLIWHIDEKYLNPETIKFNRVNIDPTTKEMGLALEEADGIEDLGRYYDYFGGPQEPFYAENNDAFTPYTNPSSDSNAGASTGLSIFNISALDTLMSFRVSFDIYQAGWPRVVSGSTGGNAPIVVDLDGDRVADLVGLVLEEGDVHLWDSAGEPWLTGSDNSLALVIEKGARSSPSVWVDPESGAAEMFVVSERNSLISISLPSDRAADLTADTLSLPVPIRGLPVIGNLNDIDGPAVALSGADFNGTVSLIDASGDQLPGWPNGSGEAVYTSPLIVPPGKTHGAIIVSLSMNGTLVGWDLDGQELWRVAVGTRGGFVLDPVAGDIDRDDNYEVFATSVHGEMGLVDLSDGSFETGWPLNIDRAVRHPPILGDIDLDGYIEPLFLVEGGEVLAYNRNGTLVSGFPVRLRAEFDKGMGPPTLAELTGSGQVELILGSQSGEIWAFEMNGRVLPGFPKSMAGAVRTASVIDDLDGDGDLEILAVSGHGVVSVWDHDAAAGEKPIGWSMQRGDPARTNTWPLAELPLLPAGDERLLSGFYNYPNPTRGNATTFRYRLTESSDVDLDLFTLDGRKLLSETREGVGPEYNEIVVDLNRFPNGVYICRLEARNRTDGRMEVKFCKMAVTR